jgi:hypothetical protein
MVPDAPAAESNAGKSLAPYRRHLLLLACVWTAAVAGSLAWNLAQIQNEIRSLTRQTARALLERDLLYRQWSILHGGVYVLKSGLAESGASSADGADEEREIRTPSGRLLTLLNPALVSRQIFQSQEDNMGIRGRLTSLRPLRKANLPDAWERRVLERLAQTGRGELTNEISSTEVRQGERYFRMMCPLVTNRGCLQCHEEKGRKEGELRGGISVTVPMSRFATPGESRNVALAQSVVLADRARARLLGATDFLVKRSDVCQISELAQGLAKRWLSQSPSP